ncbi:MAG: SdrD B-like domain-containing protein, partial [Pseudomonadota bacterium]
VSMAELVDTPNLVPADTGLEVYGIDDDQIDGAFELTVEARFDDLSGSYQRVIDFGNGPGQDNIVLGQLNATDDMYFAVFVDGTQYSIIAPGEIEQGIVAKWTAAVDASGYMRLWKDDVLVAEGQGAVPANVERSEMLVGESHWAADDRLDGMVRFLETVNVGDEPEYVHLGLPSLTVVAPDDLAEGDAGDTGVLRFEVRLDQPAPAVVTADVTILGGTGPSEIIIPAGQQSTIIEVPFAGNDDFGPDKTVSVSLSNVTLSRTGNTLEASATILDDDAIGTFLRANYFEISPVSSLEEIDFAAQPDFSEVVSTIDTAAGSGAFYAGGPIDNFAVQYEGGLWLDTGGTYSFYLNSDDGSALYIDGERVINNDGLHAPVEETATINLDEGQHLVEVLYFERSGGATLELDWSGPGFDRAPIDFTYSPPPVQTGITGRYFVDMDGNGAYSIDDELVVGAQVTLVRNGAPSAETTTAADGSYRFDNVDAGGGYRVAFEDPADALGRSLDFITSRVGGDPLADSDVIWTNGQGDGTTRKFSITDGEVFDGIDAGLIGADPEPEPEPEPGETGIAGLYFLDLDGTGTFTSGDSIVEGAQVTLVLNGTAAGQTMTRSDGSYSFSGIAAGGGYRVAFEDPTDALGQSYEYITEQRGSDPLIDSDVIWTNGQGDGTTRKITVTEGVLFEGMNAGLLASDPSPEPEPEPEGEAEVTGRYFTDLDNSQNYSAGDGSVGGATVWLLRNGVEVAQTTTAVDGTYSFTGLAGGGGYRMAFEAARDALGEDLPYITTRVGSDEIDSDILWSNREGHGHSYKFSLIEGTNLSGMNAGLVGAVNITATASLSTDSGADTITGYSGADNLYGGFGADSLSGGSGPDELLGVQGRDTLLGNGGADILEGHWGADKLLGGRGHDLLKGGEGADKLTGGKGSDTLKGGAGDDTLKGGGSRDVLVTGDGSDVLKGGGGADVFRLLPGFDVAEIYLTDGDQLDLSRLTSIESGDDLRPYASQDGNAL